MRFYTIFINILYENVKHNIKKQTNNKLDECVRTLFVETGYSSEENIFTLK